MQVTKPPKTKRVFATEWHEAKYLLLKACYWMHYRCNYRNALRYIKRLKFIIGKIDMTKMSILGAEARALIADYECNIKDEIRYTKEIINKINKLMSCPGFHISEYDSDDIRNLHEILIGLYIESNNIKQAETTTNKFKLFCKKHKIKWKQKEYTRVASGGDERREVVAPRHPATAQFPLPVRKTKKRMKGKRKVGFGLQRGVQKRLKS
jgi:hypothetical protein